MKLYKESNYKKKIAYLLVGVLLCGVFAGTFHKGDSSATVLASSLKSSINQAEQNKKQLEEKKKAMEAKLSELEKEKDNLLAYIEKLDGQLRQLHAEMEELNKKIKRVDEELVQIEKELEEAIAQEEKQYNSMKLRIKYMYENGDSDYIELLMESESVSDLLNRTEYIAKISEYDQKSYENYKMLKQKVIDTQNQLEERKAELDLLKEELAYEENTINRIHSQKSAEVAKYEENIDEADEQVAAYKKKIQEEEDRIERLLEEERKRIEEEKRRQEAAKKAAAANKAPSGTAGPTGFIWPLSISGRITSYFGSREQPTPGASTNHKGIDVGAATGTPILAAAAGEVVTSKYASSAGNYIMIYHGNSTYTVYMHCSKLYVSEGQQVKQGQTIAAVGSTGYSTGPHLHFGISINGSYVNPLSHVKQ